MVSKKKAAATWWLSQRAGVAIAVDSAEDATGHQIVVAVGKLGRRPVRTANKVARKNHAASLVFCVDPLHRNFELRWSSAVSLPADVLEKTSILFAEEKLAEAIGFVARSLPIQDPGDEIHDIVGE